MSERQEVLSVSKLYSILESGKCYRERGASLRRLESHVVIWKKSVPGTGNSNCKSLEVGAGAMCENQQGSEGGCKSETKERTTGNEISHTWESRTMKDFLGSCKGAFTK